jgi:hypothetical protein
MTNCSKCGQVINEVVIINGKPFGTTCAQVELGIKQFPTWFKGGDWDKAKADYDANAAKQAVEHDERRVITSKAWAEWQALSIAKKDAYAKGNDWLVSFFSSIMEQLGYYTYIAETKWDTMEDAEKGWQSASGSFPYLNNEPKKIETLSQKQQNILYKYL